MWRQATIASPIAIFSLLQHCRAFPDAFFMKHLTSGELLSFQALQKLIAFADEYICCLSKLLCSGNSTCSATSKDQHGKPKMQHLTPLPAAAYALLRASSCTMSVAAWLPGQHKEDWLPTCAFNGENEFVLVLPQLKGALPSVLA